MIELRPVRADDEELLFRIYAGTRIEELALTDWGEPLKETFLRGQFGAQRDWYRQQYGEQDFFVVLKDGEAVGRLYLYRSAAEIRIVDISLLPARRGEGTGTRLLRRLLEEGEAFGVPLSIHVEKMNRARRLYSRLGFEVVEDRGVYDLMYRQPPAIAQDEPPPRTERVGAGRLD